MSAAWPVVARLLRTSDPGVVPGGKAGNAFWDCARDHGVTYVVAEQLRASGYDLKSHCPAIIAETRANLVNNLRIISRLAEISTKANALGLRMFCFKGPVVGWQAYGSVAVRGAGDIDLWVARDEVERMADLLVELGFRCGSQFRGRDYREFHFHLPFSDNEGFEVEVHWAITRDYAQVPFDFERLWQRREWLELPGLTLWGLRAEDHLLVLLVHGARHLWECLIWVCDIAGMVRRYPGMDWDELLGEAQRLGCLRMALLGLYLAALLLDAPVPAGLLSRAYSDPVVLSLARGILTRYDGDSGDLGALERDWYGWRLRERWRDKARFLVAFPLRDYVDMWEDGELAPMLESQPGSRRQGLEGRWSGIKRWFLRLLRRLPSRE